jgi:hypothetical protein
VLVAGVAGGTRPISQPQARFISFQELVLPFARDFWREGGLYLAWIFGTTLLAATLFVFRAVL